MITNLRRINNHCGGKKNHDYAYQTVSDKGEIKQVSKVEFYKLKKSGILQTQ